MPNLIGLLVQYSLIYCLIVGLILCLRGPIYKIAGARWAYALWFTLFAPLVAPLLPWLLSFSPGTPSSEVFAFLDRENYVTSADSFGIFAIAAVCIWFSGVLIMTWRAAHSSLRLKLALNANSQGLTKNQQRELNQICSKLRVFPCPTVRVSPDIEGPALFGVVCPIVYLPNQFFERFSASERTLMMFHELCHYRRNDAWWNVLFCILRCFFWFNPLLRIAQRRFRLDQEQSCDQLVLWDEPNSQRALYATAMLKVAAPPKSYGLIHFQSNAPEILGRMAILEHHKKTLPQSLIGFASLVILATIALIATVPAIEANEMIVSSSIWCHVYQGLSL